MGETSRLVSQSEYARHRRKSRQYIGRLAKAGVLVIHAGLVDMVASDAVLDDRPDKLTEPPNTQPGNSYARAKLADMVFRAKLRRLEFERRNEKLVEVAVVKNRWSSILAAIKERVWSVQDKHAPEIYVSLPAEIARLIDERVVREILQRGARAMLDELRSIVQETR